MRIIGALLLIAGLAVSAFAFFKMPTTREDAAAQALGIESSIGGTLNIGLLQDQALMFHAGLAVAIIGAIFFAAGALVRAATIVLADREFDAEG